MKNLYRVIRFIAVAILLLIVVAPAVIFVALSLTGVHQRIAAEAEKELSTLLDSRVAIGSLSITPFNRVTLRNVAVVTAPGDTALKVRQIGAGIRLGSLLSGGPVTVNYLELIGADVRLYRDSAEAPLNIEPIIRALAPKDKSKPPTLFDLKVNTLMIRACAVRYDVLSEPTREGLDRNHLAVSRLRADIRLPRIKNDNFAASIKRLGLTERSGFTLNNLSTDAAINADSISISSLIIELPASKLKIEPTAISTPGFRKIPQAIKSSPLSLGIAPGSYIASADIAPLLPFLKPLDNTFTINRLQARGTYSGEVEADIDLNLDDLMRLKVALSGDNIPLERRSLHLDNLHLEADMRKALPVISAFHQLPASTSDILPNLGNVDLRGDGWLENHRYDLRMHLASAPGALELLADGSFSDLRNLSSHITLATDESLDPSAINPRWELGPVVGDLEADLVCRKGVWNGSADMEIDHLLLRGVTYSGIAAHTEINGSSINGALSIDNEPLSLHAEAAFSSNGPTKALTASVQLQRMMLERLNLSNRWPDASASGSFSCDLEWESLSSIRGEANLNSLQLAPAQGEPLLLYMLALRLAPSRATLRSDYIDGEINGPYDFPTLPSTVTAVAARVFPALLPNVTPEEIPATNDFNFHFTLKQTENPARFFRLPASVIFPVEISGAVNGPMGDLALNLDAPFLRQGNKLIENTRLTIFAGGSEPSASLDLTTAVPTKHGAMTLNLQAEGRDNSLSTSADWKINRPQDYEGAIGLSAEFSRSDTGDIITDIGIDRSNLTFNDSVWTVNPARILTHGREILIEGLDVHRRNQFVKISGEVSANPFSELSVDIRNFSLDYLFETLGIDNVKLGGNASGTVFAKGLLSGTPEMNTPGIAVSDISYNKVVLGNANVTSHWDNDTRGITLEASIQEPEMGRMSYVDGAIYPMADSLDITFTVDHARVGFMEYYMQAFASDISGYASGKARLWGNFKYIDLEGDVKAEDLRLRVNFTNTYYHTSDSVHFRPGLIDLSNITIRDAENHPARLNGWVRHKFFKEPRFEFAITDARNFLSYNESPRDNQSWYGKIYGDGSAFVHGEPGRVDISVDMATAPRSSFTFVLSDQQVADEYSFLLFRDKNAAMAELTDTVTLRDTSMDLVNNLRKAMENNTDDSPSDYNISLQMRVTPEAQITLVMDPVGGDRIRTNGSGHLRMDYRSANNDLKMYGTYELERGNYNFTLQDIIIKDFSIKPGSKIVFNGDPYGAVLDIRAAYALNANLSDLDESFLQDKDLNRTNVPVHAVMIVRGDIRQPEIAFDLEFPTLTSDVYRKVRSIISTDDMMNRQIIYLLALNRFYTPDYMRSTTKGNELVSVASSTISSQLSNLLGQISDNWNIAPTFRSDRGDFSDVEVDVALSSRLLNNRLLFNGNFGYRDNAMNSSQFIGDFDLEYLLDRSGRWRLKAYNRYNDQNYYLRTAPTTQGVGVVLKRDFDSFFSFLRRFRKKASDSQATSVEK